MKRHEFDFRYDWVALTLQALSSGFDRIGEQGEEQPWFDEEWQAEYGEALLGVAFVALQTYILGTVEDVNRVRIGAGKKELDKTALYSEDSHPLPNGVSRILLINSLANYYKHHDEWKGWPANPTTKTLAAVGIGKGTEFPCYEGATRLWSSNEFDLESLLTMSSEWRKYILSKYT